MDVTADNVAGAVVGNANPFEPPTAAVKLRGYVGVAIHTVGLIEEDGKPSVDDDGNAVTGELKEARLYTTASFDEWFVIPTEVRHLVKDVDDEQRSLVWIDADAVLTHCRLMDAADVSQTLSAGMDDPTAYPRGPRG